MLLLFLLFVLFLFAGLVSSSSGCTIDRKIPNGRLACKQPADCPQGLQCTETLTGKVCCRFNGGCASPGVGGSSGAVQIFDDGFDEADVATTCAGNLCITGGITP
jgi:hypothetical protein